MMIFPSMSRLAALVHALNSNKGIVCILTGRKIYSGTFDVDEMSDEQKRDIGLLDGRPIYRRP